MIHNQSINYSGKKKEKKKQLIIIFDISIKRDDGSTIVTLQELKRYCYLNGFVDMLVF